LIGVLVGYGIGQGVFISNTPQELIEEPNSNGGSTHQTCVDQQHFIDEGD
jgi:hypothetical protein